MMGVHFSVGGLHVFAALGNEVGLDVVAPLETGSPFIPRSETGSRLFCRGVTSVSASDRYVGWYDEMRRNAATGADRSIPRSENPAKESGLWLIEAGW
jgi:hypothetical protein